MAATTVDTPVGRLTLGATADGVVRSVFEGHGDVPALLQAVDGRRGSRAAREHLAAAKEVVAAYFAGRPAATCTIDWARVEGGQTLRAAMAVPRAQLASYDVLDTPAGARERGRLLGSNPLAILVPCHRVLRGRETPRRVRRRRRAAARARRARARVARPLAQPHPAHGRATCSRRRRGRSP